LVLSQIVIFLEAFSNTSISSSLIVDFIFAKASLSFTTAIVFTVSSANSDMFEKNFLENKFQDIINDGTIYGATSNPAIFAQSITNSEAYINQIQILQANDGKKIYEQLAILDIKRAAGLLYPLYEQNPNNGFISIEVDPALCDDTQATIDEGIRLFDEIGYNNVMIKIPATTSGYEAMKHLTSLGINVNATLVFSHIQAIKCANALNDGISQSKKTPKAVISVFV